MRKTSRKTRCRQTARLCLNAATAIVPDVDTDVADTDDSDAGTGERKITANTLQSVTGNAAPSIRHDILEGRKYMIVPMVMLTEGVHAGSNGPLYYPSAELAKTPVVWNHKPVVVYHPQMNGAATSACQPAVISRRKVGLILNTTWEPAKRGQPGKLKAEAWLEIDRLKTVDPRVLKSIQNGEMVEVSTGLFTDNESVVGRWGKEDYSSIARNYRPDHLAILPDEIGACSIRDGAGLLRNSGDDSKPAVYTRGVVSYKPRTQGESMNRKQAINAIIANTETPWETADREFLADCDETHFDKIATNAGIIRKDGQDYIADPDGDDNDQNDDAKGQIAPKKMGSKSGATKNAGRDVDDKTTPKQTPADRAAAKRDIAADGNETGGKSVMNMSEMSVEDYVNNAPAGIRDVLTHGVRQLNTEKTRLSAIITANKSNQFTAAQLAEKPVSELTMLAALATSGMPTPATNRFSTNWAGVGDVAAPTANTTGVPAAPKPLPVPVMKFQRAKSN